MKKILFPMIACALFISCNKLKKSNDTRITIGDVDSVYSETLKEQRKIWVYKPESINDTTYGKQRYPVLYVLDGSSHFHAVSGMVKDMAENNVAPEMIIVAILNTDRSRDLTPTHSLLMPDGKSQPFLESSGGGENFTTFIEKELIPYVDAHYPTQPYRTLIGHSFGGLFAINTIVHHPNIFDAYIAIDPSMWWDKQKLLKQSDSILKTNSFKRKMFYVSVANTLPADLDTITMAKDTTGNTFHIRSIFKYIRNTQSTKSNGLQFAWKYYPKDDHGSVPLISEYDGLRFIFGYYKFPYSDDMTLEQVDNHYKVVSEKLGYNIPAPPNVIGAGGYFAVRGGKFDEAFKFYSRNVQTHPKVADSFDGMGDYYIAVGDTVKAIGQFEQALAIKENPYLRKKMEGLKKPKG